jgi:hypothetical protein
MRFFFWVDQFQKPLHRPVVLRLHTTARTPVDN